MRIGIDIAQQRMAWSELVRRAQWADDAGFDGLWGFDHFQPMYGSGPGECFEGYTTLAALTGLTRRIRLGLLVTGVTYRPPALLAAEAVTIDHASGGRLEFSLGAAWFEAEHRALGFAYPATRDRIALLDEALTAIRGLWTQDAFSFAGDHLTIREATLDPKPVQRPHPPIWIGAGGERRMLPLVAKHADAWHAFAAIDDLARKSRRLDELAQEAGRDPASILRAASLDLSRPWDEVRRDVDRLHDHGFSYLICGWPSEGIARLDEFVTDLMHEVSTR